MKKPDKSKLVTTLVFVILCGMFVGMFAYGLSSVLAMEGTFPPYEYEESKSNPPETKDELIAYINSSIKIAADAKARLEVSNRLDIGDELQNSLSVEKNEKLKELILFRKKDIDAYYEKILAKSDCDFGENFETVLNAPSFSAEDIVDFDVNYIYYQCSVCGEKDDEMHDECGKCKTDRPYIKKYNDKYTIHINLKLTDELMNGNFKKRSSEELKELYNGAFSDYSNLNDIGATYNTLSVKVEIDRLTDGMIYFEYIKNADVDIDFDFSKSYMALGNEKLAFNVTEKEGFYFIYPSISLNTHYQSMEPKGSTSLSEHINYKDSEEYKVEWTSSDESVVSVDDSGVLTSEKKCGEAFITASVKLGDEIYTDTCKVEVKVSVERSAMSKKKIKLDIGEAFDLEPKITPSNATIKTVKWYSDNEKVATVDENGSVTAIGKGVTGIYFLTDDGYFKSSCEVTVR